jgi:hypothetical protein
MSLHWVMFGYVEAKQRPSRALEPWWQTEWSEKMIGRAWNPVWALNIFSLYCLVCARLINTEAMWDRAILGAAQLSSISEFLVFMIVQAVYREGGEIHFMNTWW